MPEKNPWPTKSMKSRFPQSAIGLDDGEATGGTKFRPGGGASVYGTLFGAGCMSSGSGLSGKRSDEEVYP